MTRPGDRRPLKAPEARQRTTNPSPLAAALAQAVLDAHAKRTGCVPVVDAMSVAMERDNADEALGAPASQPPAHPALQVIEGGRGAPKEP